MRRNRAYHKMTKGITEQKTKKPEPGCHETRYLRASRDRPVLGDLAYEPILTDAPARLQLGRTPAQYARGDFNEQISEPFLMRHEE